MTADRLPIGTLVREVLTGEVLEVAGYTDQGDGYVFADGSWLRFHHLIPSDYELVKEETP